MGVHLLLQLADELLGLAGVAHLIGTARLGDLLLPAAAATGTRHGALHDVGHRLADGPGRDAVTLVVGDLLRPAPLGLVDGAPHGTGDLVGIEDHLAVRVARGAADGLDERAVGTQEALLVGVEDGDQRHLGDVQALAQQVDADQHIELAEAQVADDLHALDGIDVRMQVAHPHAMLLEIVGQILGHALGEGGHQHPLVGLDAGPDLGEQVVDLGGHRPHFDLGIDQAGGADDLLDHLPGVLQLVGAGRGRDEDGLRRQALELVEAQRPVVERRRQAEAVFDQVLLAGAVATVHAA